MSSSDPLNPDPTESGAPAEPLTETTGSAAPGFAPSPEFGPAKGDAPELDVVSQEAEIRPIPDEDLPPVVPQAKGSRDKGSELKLTPRRDWIVLRIVIALVGLALVANGVWGALAGTAGIFGMGATTVIASNPTLENDYSFLSAVLAGVGLAFLWVAWALDHAGPVLAVLCGIIFLGAIARVLSWAITGTPHWTQILLMILELVVPPLLLLWYGWIRRTQKLKASFLAQR